MSPSSCRDFSRVLLKPATCETSRLSPRSAIVRPAPGHIGGLQVIGHPAGCRETVRSVVRLPGRPALASPPPDGAYSSPTGRRPSGAGGGAAEVSGDARRGG